MNTHLLKVDENTKLIAEVTANPSQVELLPDDKFVVVVEDAAAGLFAQLVKALGTIEGGKELLYAYDTLSHFDTSKASLIDRNDARAAIEKYLTQYTDK